MLLAAPDLQWWRIDEQVAITNTGQRPWKTYQHEWKSRYIALLNKETPVSASSQNSVEKSADYKALKDDYDQLRQQTKPQVDKINAELAEVNGNLLAVRSVFTDRRAYVNALNYDIETEKSASGKKSYQRELDDYKKKLATVEFPDGSKKSYTFQQLEEAFNEVNAEKNRLSLQLGDVLKPVAEANTKMLAYVSDHMVDLSPSQIEGLKKKTDDWDPHIVVQVLISHTDNRQLKPTSWIAASPVTWAFASR